MRLKRRQLLALSLALAARPAWALGRDGIAETVLTTWYRLILELVRHTATYSPPVASRAFAYIGVAAHEALATGNPALVSLAGQLTDLVAPPVREAGAHDEAVVLQAALAASAQAFFGNTGPTGQRAMGAVRDQLGAKAAEGLPADVVQRSVRHGEAIAAHILDWSLADGGATIENMGFPRSHASSSAPQDWMPTSLIRQQQTPLLPTWGGNRPFAMPQSTACPVVPPPAYSDESGSEFHAAAMDVLETSKTLTPEQRLIARFWSDDPMLSPTPPGHWIAILLSIAEAEGLPADRTASVLATLGVAMADAFIACWAAKFEHNLLRPVTYIRRTIDPAWEPLLITPPFPEYPSGHSTQSAAAATVLTAAFGEDFAFDDLTHEDEGLPVRSFPSFWAAAEEAAISRLYGGIHYRFGITAGLDQGRCVGDHAAALRVRQ